MNVCNLVKKNNESNVIIIIIIIKIIITLRIYTTKGFKN